MAPDPARAVSPAVTLPLPPPVKGGEIYEVPSPLVGEGEGEGYADLFVTSSITLQFSKIIRKNFYSFCKQHNSEDLRKPLKIT
jgi:hypothetical protein